MSFLRLHGEAFSFAYCCSIRNKKTGSEHSGLLIWKCPITRQLPQSKMNCCFDNLFIANYISHFFLCAQIVFYSIKFVFLMSSFFLLSETGRFKIIIDKLEFCLTNWKYHGARWKTTELFSFLGISEIIHCLSNLSQRVMHFSNNKLAALNDSLKQFYFLFPHVPFGRLVLLVCHREEINCLGIPELALHYNQSHYQNMFVHWKTCFTTGFLLYLGETFLCRVNQQKHLLDPVGTKN